MIENAKELTNENIKNIKYDDIVAVTIAEVGAMGEPSGFYVAMNNYDLYHTNFRTCPISNEQLFITFPLLKTFDCSCSQVINLDYGWKSFYMGVGNYLVVRKEYYDVILNYINENLPLDNQYAHLYKNWYDIILKVIK